MFLLLCKSFNLLLHEYLHTAQDLLDSWLHEKKRDDFNLEVQFKDEKWSQRSKPLDHVTRNSVSEDYYDDFVGTSDALLQSRDWTTLNSSHNSQSPNVMGKLFSVDFFKSLLIKKKCYSIIKFYGISTTCIGTCMYILFQVNNYFIISTCRIHVVRIFDTAFFLHEELIDSVLEILRDEKSSFLSINMTEDYINLPQCNSATHMFLVFNLFSYRCRI